MVNVTIKSIHGSYGYDCPYPAMLIDFAGLPAIFRYAQIRNLVHQIPSNPIFCPIILFTNPWFPGSVQLFHEPIPSNGKSRIFLILKSWMIWVSVQSSGVHPRHPFLKTDFP